MKRIISLFFVLIIILSIFCVSVSAIVPHSTVDELGMKERVFVYDFLYETTYEKLKTIVNKYNKEKGIENSDGYIKALSSEDYYINVAHYTESSVIIYIDVFEEGLKDSTKHKILKYFYDELQNNFDETDVYNFFNSLWNNSADISSVMLPVIMQPNIAPCRPASGPVYIITEIITPIIGYISLGYLIYVIIYLIYSKIKKKKLKNIKIKIVLSLLSFFYILFGGLSGIISWILSMANSI